MAVRRSGTKVKKRASAARGPKRVARPKRASGPKRASAKTVRKPARSAAPARRKPARRPAADAPQPMAVASEVGKVPNAIGIVSHHLDYNSHALDDVRRFYTELLGFGRYEFDDTIQYLYIPTGPSSSLGFMPPAAGPPEEWRPPREPGLYFFVEDVDRAYRRLLDGGATFTQPPTDMPWGHRVASLRDPEGRLVTLAQRLDR